jgi:cell division protein FtsW (lipid II flippase)
MASGQQNEEWLIAYHSRLTAEQQFSHSRRDTVTNSGLTLFLAILVAYAASLSYSVPLPHFWKMSLLLVGLGLLIRFFSQGMISYAFLRKWRYLGTAIESHWATGQPSLEEIRLDIETYDHEGRTTVSKRSMLWSQLRAGFLLNFVALLAIVLWELDQIGQWAGETYAVVAGFIVYVLWEIYIFVTYRPLRMPPKKEKTLPQKT